MISGVFRPFITLGIVSVSSSFLLVGFDLLLKTIGFIDHILQSRFVSSGSSLSILLFHVLKHESNLIFWVGMDSGEHHWFQNVIDLCLKPEFVLVGLHVSSRLSLFLRIFHCLVDNMGKYFILIIITYISSSSFNFVFK